MRLHISLDDDLVKQLDRRAGKDRRSSFINEAVRRRLEDELRWDEIEAGFGALAVHEHEWDRGVAGWVAAQRHSDPMRVG